MKASTQAFAALILAASAGPACSFLPPHTDTTRYAVLASVDELPGDGTADAPAMSPSVRVGLGPVTLPEYVRRPELVSRVGGTRIVVSGSERWAEPLDRAVVRVLAIDLERTLGTGRVVNHPWYERDRPDVQIEIAFSRCERDESGKVVVAARWSVRELAGEAQPIEKESRIEREAVKGDGPSTSLALSESLAELCREIASTWTDRDAAGAAPR